MIRVVVCGACGRMGSEVARLLLGATDLELAGAVEAFGHPLVGTPLGKGMVSAGLASLADRAGVVVDFTNPETTVEHARLCADKARPYVTGVTGLTPEQAAELRKAAARIPLVHAPNFSVGVAVLAWLVREAAGRLGAEYDVEIVEVHHRRKADAPSGTAKLLASEVAQARKETKFRHGREGQVGAKPLAEVGISSIRSGDVVGEHTVVFGGAGERIELGHKAESRAAFASGVLSAIRFVSGRRPGLYTMADVLGIS